MCQTDEAKHLVAAKQEDEGGGAERGLRNSLERRQGMIEVMMAVRLFWLEIKC